MKKEKNILVIGGAGYLGSVLVPKLINRGYEVRVFDNLTFGTDSLKKIKNKPNFKFVKGDIRNIPLVKSALQGMDACIYLAGLTDAPSCDINPSKTIEINYVAPKKIAKLCAKIKISRFIFASTCNVYGMTKSDFVTEEAPVNPLTLYSECKIKVERDALLLASESFAPCSLRLSTLFGVSPRMRFDLAVNKIVADATIKKKIKINGGKQWRPFLHVDDAVNAFVTCLDTPAEKIKGQIFNVGSNNLNYQIINLGRIIQKNIPKVKMEIKKQQLYPESFRVSFEKINKILGFSARRTIENGILEIRVLLEKKLITDYTNFEYHNFKTYHRKFKR